MWWHFNFSIYLLIYSWLLHASLQMLPCCVWLHCIDWFFKLGVVCIVSEQFKGEQISPHTSCQEELFYSIQMLDRKNNELEEFRSHYTLQHHQLAAKCKRLEAKSTARSTYANGCNHFSLVHPTVVVQLEKERGLSEKQRERESSEASQATEEHQQVLRGHLEKKVSNIHCYMQWEVAIVW